MAKNIYKNKTICLLLVLAFITVTIFDGGTLVFGSILTRGNNANLSPTLMSPNDLAQAESNIINVIRFSLLAKLEQVLDGYSIKDIDYEQFMSIVRKRSVKDNRIGDSQLKSDTAWFFMNEAYEQDGDIFVRCRLLYEGRPKTYQVIFNLSKDSDDGFLIKGIFPEKRAESISFNKKIVAGSKQKGDTKLQEGSFKTDDPEKKDTLRENSRVSDEDEKILAEKEKNSFSRYVKKAGKVSFLKKSLLLIFMMMFISLSAGRISHSAVKSFYEPPYEEYMGVYLENITPETTRSIMEFSGRTGIDVSRFFSMELVEVNTKGVIPLKGEEEMKRILSKYNAVGAWQLTIQSAKDINVYIKRINEMEKNGEYIGPLDRSKMRIIKELGLEEGIDLKKIDHRLPEYEADYNRRGAALLLALNRYTLERLKLVKNKKRKGWSFLRRSDDEPIGYDLDEVLLLTHNCDIYDVKEALRKGGPNGYWEYLPGETQIFDMKIKKYRKVLEKEPYRTKFNRVIQEAFKEDQKVVKKRESVPDKETFLPGNMGEYISLFLIIIIGWFREISILVTEAWRKIKAQEKISDNIEKSAIVSKKPVAPPGLPEKDMIKSEEREKRQEYYAVYQPKTDQETRLKEAGMLLGPPFEKYTFYVSTDFCPVKDFERDEFKYGSRFNLKLVKRDDVAKIADYVLKDISINGIDPTNVVVQLPVVSEKDDVMSKLQELTDMGIRFISLDIDGYKSEFPDEEETNKYRENMYAFMLILRKLSVATDNVIMVDTLRSLINNYAVDKAGEDVPVEKFLKAVIDSDLSELVKVILIYKPMVKVVDEKGKRLDLRPLIFA